MAGLHLEAGAVPNSSEIEQAAIARLLRAVEGKAKSQEEMALLLLEIAKAVRDADRG